jgi:ParB-like chromosome segregation protein Spo0J
MAGLPELPCIEREVSGDRRLLEQLEINLLREDVPWLEVAEAFRILIDKFGYKQVDLSRRFNKHKSGISELYSMSKLDDSVKKRVSEGGTVVAKEVLVAASRKQSPEEQMQIVEMALRGKRTKKIREAIRSEKKDGGVVKEGNEEVVAEIKGEGLEDHPVSGKEPIEGKDAGKFTEFRWEPEDKAFQLVIVFAQPQLEKKKNIVVKEALGQAYKYVTKLIYRSRLHSKD